MIGGGYDAFDDPYAYPGTTVLKNLLGTKDPEVLSAFELEMTALRSRNMLVMLSTGRQRSKARDWLKANMAA